MLAQILNGCQVTDDSSFEIQRVKDFFLARQPILNRDQKLVAYELLFRRADVGLAAVTDDLAATASVIAHASELGLETVIGASRGFVNVDAAVLMSDFIEFLPCEKIVLEILETVKITDEVVARVTELVKSGYTFALDDVIVDSPDLHRLLPLVEIIKIDIMGMTQNNLTKLSAQFKFAKKKILAEKVETLEQFNFCLGLGFDYFQGYYFAKPLVLTGKKLSPSQLAIVRLMNLVLADADTVEIERLIKHDASLGLNLLRLVNTPAFLITQRVESLGQALALLGRRQLQRWLQILLYAESGKADGFTSPLLMLATTRGKLLELIAQKTKPGNRTIADVAFTVGIMSLMDALFNSPMEKILEQITVPDEVKEALLYRSGTYGEMLRLAEYTEHLEEAGQMLPPALKRLQLTNDELYAMQVAAFEWSDSISRGVA
ncbi:MAG TPA: EAL domain-containing protein [Oxalobacteraceae bacterium]|nr:EAL domain-containing protein [Oxalobacteraceae bacterium]